MHRNLTCLLALAALGLTPSLATAARSYDNCTGFVTSLPATITTQGTWCMSQNLSTAITSGAAITIGTNNVTLDCNDFKIGGLGGGADSTVVGIYANGRMNATVRNCNLRGFHDGISLNGTGGGHLIEDNRIDQSLQMGLYASGEDNLVRRNAVYNTGGGTFTAEGIRARADIIDNVVTGVTVVDDGTVWGITLDGQGGEVARGNVISGLQTGEGGFIVGLQVQGNGNALVKDNRITFGPGFHDGNGIYAYASSCMGNTVIGLLGGIAACSTAADNYVVTPF